jgi:RNA-directed DNA polymerase
MTKPRYPMGYAAGSQERRDASVRDASDPESYAWYVNLNNGNVNINNRNNRLRARVVRSAVPGECQSAGSAQVSLRALYDAFRAARQHKQPSRGQVTFESFWFDRLLDLQERLNAGTWSPGRTICFIAQRPKAREIHAPPFADRVVHHLVVPMLEAIYEPLFIHDSFANRGGKGTHRAVDRLRGMVREVESGQGRAWYLQLDIHNFFVSIHRPTLYALLKRRMERAGMPEWARRAVHAMLVEPLGPDGVLVRATAAERAQVPAHKMLENAARGCGIPIGNLSSQFFANVYLHELDVFVKHALRARRYVRYVDDFVLVHESREQLQAWQAQIEAFLRDQLRLRVKPETKLRPASDGIDFLGYILMPTHVRVRRRVISHAREALTAWQAQHVTATHIRATPAALRKVGHVWGSYLGHFGHANSQRLCADFDRRFPWLRQAIRRRRFPAAVESRTFNLKRARPCT